MSNTSEYKTHTKNRLIILAGQFIKFGLVGVSNTVISLIVYYGLLYLGINYLVAYIIGFIISVFNAFFWNKKYVFHKTQGRILGPLVRTYVSYGSTFALATELIYIMVHYFSIAETIAPIINLLVTIPLNFFLNKFWTFK